MDMRPCKLLKLGNVIASYEHSLVQILGNFEGIYLLQCYVHQFNLVSCSQWDEVVFNVIIEHMNQVICLKDNDVACIYCVSP